MRYGTHRRWRRILAAAGVLSVGLALVVFLLVPGTHRGHSRGPIPRSAGTTTQGLIAPTSPQPYRPPRVIPARSAQQSTVDSELSQAEQHFTLPAGGVDALPAAAYSSGYPAVPAADLGDAASFATAFVSELVDRDYARQSRQQLLAWAQAESAPNTLPGLDPALTGHSLALSLIDPVPPPGPVPPPAVWTQAAAAEQVQTVTNIETAVNADWLALTSSGWQPSDPAMTVLTVTANLNVAGPGGGRTESFSLQLTLGSNGSRPGYGAVAVDDWTVT